MNPPLTPVDGETESRDVVWAAGHAGAVGEGWQGRGDCAVAGDNETLLLFSAGGVFKGHQLPRLHRARRQRWQDWGEESFSGHGAVACSACSLLLAAGGCVILQLIFSIKSIESVPDLVYPWRGGHFYQFYLSINAVSVTFITNISISTTDCISIYKYYY